MPKLSYAKRHRRPPSLAACLQQQQSLPHSDLLVQTPRRVSEEDIQNNDAAATTAKSVDIKSSLSRNSPNLLSPPRSRLKRPAPSTCLADLVRDGNELTLVNVMQMQQGEDQQMLRTTRQYHQETGEAPVEGARGVSPIWGHFVDIIQEDEYIEAVSLPSSRQLFSPQDSYLSSSFSPSEQKSGVLNEYYPHPYFSLSTVKTKEKKKRRRIQSPSRLDSSSLPDALAGLRV